MHPVFIQITPEYSGNVCQGKIPALSQFFFFYYQSNPYFQQIDDEIAFGFRSAK